MPPSPILEQISHRPGFVPVARLICSPEIADQDQVLSVSTTRDGELLAVHGPGKREQRVTPEVSQLLGWAAVNGLAPKVRRTSAAIYVLERAAIMAPVNKET